MRTRSRINAERLLAVLEARASDDLDEQSVVFCGKLVGDLGMGDATPEEIAVLRHRVVVLARRRREAAARSAPAASRAAAAAAAAAAATASTAAAPLDASVTGGPLASSGALMSQASMSMIDVRASTMAVGAPADDDAAAASPAPPTATAMAMATAAAAHPRGRADDNAAWREELFDGARAPGAAGAQQQQQQAGVTLDDVTGLLQQQAEQLKLNAREMLDMVRSDLEVVGDIAGLQEKGQSDITRENALLKQQLAQTKRDTTLIYLAVVVVWIVFMATYIFIRLFPKRLVS